MRPGPTQSSVPATSTRAPRGQVILLFAFAMIAILAMAALLIDGGLAWSNRRQAQSAADTAALAAALALGKSGDLYGAANKIAALNGFDTNLVACNGSKLPGQGVVVNNPPLTGPHRAGVDPNAKLYIEVVVTRAMQTNFARAIGMPCWLVSARAVAAITKPSGAGCNFCSLNNTTQNHSLLLKSGAHLRVDGDIFVNSLNGLRPYDNGAGSFGNGTPCIPTFDGKKKDTVCGDGFDMFGDHPWISARHISVVGGWEEQGDLGTAVTIADVLAQLNGADCPLHPEPIFQIETANICIGMPVIADPLNDSAKPQDVIPAPDAAAFKVPVAGVNGCAALPGTLGVKVPLGSGLVITSGAWTICPGIYAGGITISGGSVTLASGIYYLQGGGFSVTGSGSVDGSAGVMLYNTSSAVADSSSTTNPGTDLLDTIKPNPLYKYTPLTTGGGLGLVVATTAAPPLSAPVVPAGGSMNAGQAVKLTFTIGKATSPAGAGAIGGMMTFYDGDSPISAACTNVVPTNGAGGKKVGTCTASPFPLAGTHYLTALYLGDATSKYNPVEAQYTLTVKAPPGPAAGEINIQTSGNVKLHGPTSGPYSGLVIFQDRTIGLTITLSPGSGESACTGSWMTNGVPGHPGVVPQPCGALGGLQGTIYAPHQGSSCKGADKSGQGDCATVAITASGLANLQIISNEIFITNAAEARFAFTPQFFANGNIRLVE